MKPTAISYGVRWQSPERAATPLSPHQQSRAPARPPLHTAPRPAHAALASSPSKAASPLGDSLCPRTPKPRNRRFQLVLTLTTCLTLTAPAFAQSLGSTASPESEAPAATQAEAPDKAAEPDPDLVAKPSRLVGIDREKYIGAVLATFEMRDRMRDPFGRHQDPDYVPPEPEKTAPESVPDYRPEPTTPFPRIVAAIPITSVIASQDKFLIGGRGFSVGDNLRLRNGSDEMITVAVIDVRANEVVFQHTGTDETAAHTLELLPGGMSRGGSPIQPDGVTPAGKEAPVDISAGGPPGSLSSRR